MSQDVFTTVSNPDFSTSGPWFSMNMPEYLSVSANRRFLVLGNEQNLYLFDIQQPDKSWDRIPIGVTIKRAQALSSGNIALVTSDGFYVCSPRGDLIHFIESDANSGLLFWADDGWFLFQPPDSSHGHLRFLDIATRATKDFEFSGWPLYAWRTRSGYIRVLTETKRPTYLA